MFAPCPAGGDRRRVEICLCVGDGREGLAVPAVFSSSPGDFGLRQRGLGQVSSLLHTPELPCPHSPSEVSSFSFLTTPRQQLPPRLWVPTAVLPRGSGTSAAPGLAPRQEKSCSSPCQRPLAGHLPAAAADGGQSLWGWGDSSPTSVPSLERHRGLPRSSLRQPALPRGGEHGGFGVVGRRRDCGGRGGAGEGGKAR